MDRTFLRAWGRLLVAAALSCAASSFAQSNGSAPSPYQGKAFHAAAFRAPGAYATSIALDPPDHATIDAVKNENATQNKRLQIGIPRKVLAAPQTRASELQWSPSPDGTAALWQLSSAGAKALSIALVVRALPEGVELRFSGSDEPQTVYGPFTAQDMALDDAMRYWSPALRGETATVEIFVPAALAASSVDISVATISHLFVDPASPTAEKDAKAAGSCEVDVACYASDSALTNTAKAVARMLFDGSYLCTGTLLNPSDASFTPYFYSANHCISTQSSANTLTTYWFYNATACGSGVLSPSYVQLAGGATLLYASSASDASFMRLKTTPPSGAWFSGWDAGTLASGTSLVAIHHPSGDVKKVSLGTAGGFSTAPGTGGSFIAANWYNGVTEPGSSGSGIFTALGGSPAADYRLRGGLYGGLSYCGAPSSSLQDYYSRLDLVYPNIAGWINPASGATYTLNVVKGGTGGGTVTSTPAGIACGTICSAAFSAGTTVSVVPTATSGSTFTNWTGACSGSDACSVTMNATATVGAVFTLNDDHSNSYTGATSIALSSSMAGTINYAGDVDWFRVDLPGPGTWIISTTGSTDTVGDVYWPDGVSLYASNDDDPAGGTLNFRITLPVGAATTAWVRVRGSGGTATGAYTLVSSFTAQAPPEMDLNLDGRSDILYRNVVTGQVYRMIMNGPTIVNGATVYSEPNLAWSPVTVADFDGDRVPDMLWRNAATGDVALIGMAPGGTPAYVSWVWSEPSPAWNIVTTADFDGDGKADLVWWNSATGQVYIMLMNGANITRQGVAYVEPNTNWKIVASGDFAGSGVRNQLLWRNFATGQVYLMTVGITGGGFSVAGQMIYQDPNTAWKIIAAPDFNGDGKSDILWRNDATGQVFVMLMNGATISSQGLVHQEPNLNWKIVAQGDYDGDSRADLLWRNDSTGQVYLMTMNGLSVTSGTMVYQEPNTAWRIVGPWELGLGKVLEEGKSAVSTSTFVGAPLNGGTIPDALPSSGGIDVRR